MAALLARNAGYRAYARWRCQRCRSVCPGEADACWAADRALAAEEGEGYAEFFLDYVMRGDPEYPDPKAVWAWLSERVERGDR